MVRFRALHFIKNVKARTTVTVKTTSKTKVSLKTRRTIEPAGNTGGEREPNRAKTGWDEDGIVLDRGRATDKSTTGVLRTAGSRKGYRGGGT